MLSKARAISLIAVLIPALWLSSFDAQASHVVSVNIEQILSAEVAFTGTCISSESKLISLEGARGEILVTEYAFSVRPDDVLKGDVPEKFSFMQWGASREASQQLNLPFVQGMPVYEVGREYTLFLSSVSPLGLRAPVGLGQGKFNTVMGPEGQKQLVNDFGNKALFLNLPATPSLSKALSAAKVSDRAEPGPIDYASFVEIVRSLGGIEKSQPGS